MKLSRLKSALSPRTPTEPAAGDRRAAGPGVGGGEELGAVPPHRDRHRAVGVVLDRGREVLPGPERDRVPARLARPELVIGAAVFRAAFALLLDHDVTVAPVEGGVVELVLALVVEPDVDPVPGLLPASARRRSGSCSRRSRETVTLPKSWRLVLSRKTSEAVHGSEAGLRARAAVGLARPAGAALGEERAGGHFPDRRDLGIGVGGVPGRVLVGDQPVRIVEFFAERALPGARAAGVEFFGSWPALLFGLLRCGWSTTVPCARAAASSSRP